jgi:hypothetical protein
MTVSTTTSSVGPYACNGSTTEFPVTFPFLENDDLVVYLIDSDGVSTTLALDTNYTVTGAGGSSGTVTTVSTYASGYTILIDRVVDLLQETDLENQATYYPEVLEDALDKLTMIAQQLDSGVSRSIKFPTSDMPITEPVLPSRDDRLGKFLIFDAVTGQPDVTSQTISIAEYDGVFADTIADLYLVDDSAMIAGQTAIVSGFAAIGDGGGGPLRVWQTSGAPYTDNGASIIVPTSGDGSGAFVWAYDGPANVKWCGVTGDGTTDDLAAFNLALSISNELVFPAGTYRVSNLPDFSAGVSLSAHGATLLIDAGQLTADSASILEAGGLTIQGATKGTTTFTSVASVSGTSGDWSVALNVASADGIATGDIIRIKDVSPGIMAPGEIDSRVPRGQMNLAFFHMGALSVTGTTATVGGTGVSTYLAASDLVLIQGQVRRITSITNDTTFVISAALAADVSDLQYWYYVDNVPAGTISATGTTTLTCSGDYFNTFVDVGDLIWVADTGIFKVDSIESGTSLTVNLPATATAKVWGLLEFGELHEGCWIVSDVTGTVVTVTNSSLAKPPAKNSVSGNIDILNTKLNFSGNGFAVKSGTLTIADVGLVGDGTGYGIDVRPDGGAGRVILEDSPINNFAYGIRANTGASIYGQEAQVCGCASRGVDVTEGGIAWLQKATVNGNTGIGVFIGSGSYARLSDARSNGNSGQGVRLEVGGAAWMDFGYACNNGGDGILGVGGVNIHAVGCRLIANEGDGIEGQNGIYGRASGCVAISNSSAGIRVANGSLESGQCNAVNNEAYGIVATMCQMFLQQSGTSGNDSSGVIALSGARVLVTSMAATSEAIGINASTESVITGSGIGFSDNTTDTYSATGGKINLARSGDFTANITKNTMSTSFGYVCDGPI